MGKRSRRRSSGQALAEVALVAPLFFLIVFGIIDLGRVIWANDVVAGAAREGARYASVHAGNLGLTDPATKDDIKAHATDYVIAGGTNVAVTVCFSAVRIASQQAGCTGDVDEILGDGTTAGYVRGNLVTVSVTSHVPTIIRSLFGAGDWGVSGTSTVLINN
jgi:Flp pilus assembly protein TadG